MISSPCKSCFNRRLPKEKCLDTCEKIKGVQKLQYVMPAPIYAAVDSSDGSRYRLVVPSSRHVV